MLYIEGMFTRVNGGRKRHGNEKLLRVVLPSEASPFVLCIKGMFTRANSGRKRRGDERIPTWYREYADRCDG